MVLSSKCPKSLILKIICFILIQFLSVCQAEKEESCCENILLDADKEVHNMTIIGARLGFYKQFNYHEDKPTYRQEGGDFFLFYNKDKQKWIDYLVYVTAAYDNFVAGARIENENDGSCLEDKNNWRLNNEIDKYISSESLKTKCSKIEDVCCQEVNITSSNSEINHTKSVMESLGVYKAVGMNNGRYTYRKDNAFRFLWYDGYGEGWTVNGFDGGAHIYSQGLHVCPENNANEWKIKREYRKDIKLDVTCLKQERRMNESSYRTTAFVFGFFTFFLILVIIIFYGKRVCRYWLRGAHGRSLLWQTLDLE